MPYRLCTNNMIVGCLCGRLQRRHGAAPMANGARRHRLLGSLDPLVRSAQDETGMAESATACSIALRVFLHSQSVHSRLSLRDTSLPMIRRLSDVDPVSSPLRRPLRSRYQAGLHTAYGANTTMFDCDLTYCQMQTRDTGKCIASVGHRCGN